MPSPCDGSHDNPLLLLSLHSPCHIPPSTRHSPPSPCHMLTITMDVVRVPQTYRGTEVSRVVRSDSFPPPSGTPSSDPQDIPPCTPPHSGVHIDLTDSPSPVKRRRDDSPSPSVPAAKRRAVPWDEEETRSKAEALQLMQMDATENHILKKLKLYEGKSNAGHYVEAWRAVGASLSKASENRSRCDHFPVRPLIA